MKTKLLPKLLWFTILTLVGCTIAPPTEHSANTAVAPDKAAIKEWLTMFEYDSNQPLDIREIKTEQREGINIHDLTYASPVSGTVSAYLVTPDGPGPYAGILYVHWLDAPSVSTRQEFIDESVQLAQSGAVSLLVNALWASPQPFPWTGSDYEYDHQQSIRQVIELRRATDVLLSRPEVDPQRLAYVGHDFGAMTGGELCGIETRFRTYVLMAGAPRFSDWFMRWSTLKGSAREQYVQEMQSVDPVSYVGYAAPASLFFQYGRSDNWVSEKDAQAYYAVASEPKRIEWYEAGHSLMIDKASADRLEWLRTELGLSGTK
jgi:dienelactone hydrolase